jgi:hypothetical protein
MNENPYTENKPDVFTLSEHDRSLLRAGLHCLKNEYFQEIGSENYPDLLVFPETTARPLLYGIRPLIKKLYGDAGLKMPGMVFFLANATAEIHFNEDREIYPYEYYYDDEEGVSEQAGEFIRGVIDNDESIAAYIRKAHEINLERALEITNKLQPHKILIVDDVTFSEERKKTMTEIRKCFGEVDPEISIDGFAFLSDDFPYEEEPWLKVGTVRPFNEMTDESRLVFHYASRTNLDEKRARMGAEKPVSNNLFDAEFMLHVKRAEQADAEKMNSVRRQIEEVGEEFVQVEDGFIK